jgi:hypothetical protein
MSIAVEKKTFIRNNYRGKENQSPEWNWKVAFQSFPFEKNEIIGLAMEPFVHNRWSIKYGLNAPTRIVDWLPQTTVFIRLPQMTILKISALNSEPRAHQLIKWDFK